jgi:hypothetical protein
VYWIQTRPVLNRFHDCGKDQILAPYNLRRMKETVRLAIIYLKNIGTSNAF